MIDLRLLVESAVGHGTAKGVVVVIDGEIPTKQLPLDLPTSKCLILLRKSRDYLSTYNGADLLTGELAKILDRSLAILPCVSIRETLTLVSTTTKRSITDDFTIAGDSDMFDRRLLCSSPRSRVWTLDPSNFSSENRGSREDGLQQLVAALADPEMRTDAEFLIKFFAETDPAVSVRAAARALLARRPKTGRGHVRNIRRSHLVQLIPQWVEVPAGVFLMGSDPRFDPHALPEEMPQHEVFVESFSIAVRQVSQYQFDFYRYAIGLERDLPDRASDRYPCSGINWYEALGYSEWLTELASAEGLIEPDARLTLPSEAEWEKAARGADGRRYPWGNQFKLYHCNCREQNIGHIVEFGTFSPEGDSPYGVQDMCGNVWEWTRSNWGKGGRTPEYSYPYVRDDGREDVGAPSDVRRAIRGGAFYYFDYCVRCATRNVMFPETRHSGGGFRLVKVPQQRGPL